MGSIDLTVVIPTFNRPSETLQRCLRSIYSQQVRPSCIIVVDDGSEAPVLQDAARQSPPPVDVELRLVEAVHRGPAMARDAGLRSARTEWVVFTDDDCVADDRWLAELATAAGSAPLDVGGLGGAVNVLAGIRMVERFSRVCDDLNQRDLPGGVDVIFGGNCCLRRALAIEIGGWARNGTMTQSLGFEDDDLSMRIRARGYRLIDVPSASVHHQPRGTVAELRTQWLNYGSGAHRHVATWGISQKALLPYSVGNGLVRNALADFNGLWKLCRKLRRMKINLRDRTAFLMLEEIRARSFRQGYRRRAREVSS